jgi:pimeloyl-ACP methyl ester carboxylesterase
LRIDDVTLAVTVTGEGPLVLCVHGFPDDASTFRAQVPALVAAGFRVACPTIRGYAPSAVPDSGRYDPEALGRDLVALAERYGGGKPVRLVGHDWGAIAAFSAAALAPERFSHLCTMAVPHAAALARAFSAAQARRSWYIGLFQLPRLAEARLEADDFALVDRLWRDWSPGYAATADELRTVKEGLRGRSRAALGYYRALRSPGGAMTRSRRLLFARVQVPSLHLHGADDGCVGVECAQGAERWYDASYALRVVDGAGHFLQRERADMVTRELLGFFGEPGVAG